MTCTVENVPYGGSVPVNMIYDRSDMTLLLMQQTGTQTNETRDEVLAAADACVSCGLCLPHCPTYRQADNESESPRGRIAIVRGLLSGQLEADGSLLKHLDSCLLCRACEKVCPAQVKYEQIIEGVRTDLRAKRHNLHQNSGFLARVISSAIRYRRSMRPLATTLSLFQRSGLAWLAMRSRLPGISRMANISARTDFIFVICVMAMVRIL